MIVIGVQIFFHGSVPEGIDLVAGPAPSKFFKNLGAPSGRRREFIASLEAEHEASHERFRQMVSVALDGAGAESLSRQFERAGFRNVTVDVMRTGEDILAWELQAVNPAISANNTVVFGNKSAIGWVDRSLLSLVSFDKNCLTET